MLKFILNILIMVSLGTVLYFVARTLPRIDDREAEVPILKTHWTLMYLEKADRKLRFVFEKLLRKIGIILLKLDNVINKKLSKLKKENEREKSFAGIPNEEETKESL